MDHHMKRDKNSENDRIIPTKEINITRHDMEGHEMRKTKIICTIGTCKVKMRRHLRRCVRRDLMLPDLIFHMVRMKNIRKRLI